MSKLKVVRFVVLGAAAVTLAGYSAYAKRVNRAMASEQAVSFADGIAEPQISNRAAKTNRLLVQAALTDAGAQDSYMLASAGPDIEVERPANPVIAATPSIPVTQPAPVAEAKPSRAAKTAALAPAHLARRPTTSRSSCRRLRRRRQRAVCSTTDRSPG